MTEWHGGKGSRRRGTNEKKYQENWEKVFKKGKKNVSNKKTSRRKPLQKI